MSMPACRLIISPHKWAGDPMPADEKVSTPGLALAVRDQFGERADPGRGIDDENVGALNDRGDRNKIALRHRRAP